MSDKIDFGRFTMPKIYFSERVAAFAVAAIPTTTTINQNDLKVSRDTLVDLIGVSEETYSANTAANANITLIPNLLINWSLVERAGYSASGFAPLTSMHNFYEGDRSVNPVIAANTGWGVYLWKHALPWIYNPSDNIGIDWVIPAVTAGVIAGTRMLTTSINTVGLRTGLRRLYQIRNINLVPSGGLGASQGTAANVQTMANLGEEQYRSDSFSLQFAATVWPGTDIRFLNHARIRVVPSVGESWSDVPVPLAFYGINMGMAHRVVWHKPVGGPILVRAGQSITFDIQNMHGAINTNVQVALVGRVAAGIGSVA